MSHEKLLAIWATVGPIVILGLIAGLKRVRLFILAVKAAKAAKAGLPGLPGLPGIPELPASVGGGRWSGGRGGHGGQGGQADPSPGVPGGSTITVDLLTFLKAQSSLFNSLVASVTPAQPPATPADPTGGVNY